MATAQTLIDSTQARAKDPSKTQWSDTEMLGYVNSAIDYIHGKLIEAQSELALKYNTAAITTVDGTETYDLPTDFWAVYEGDKRDRTGVHLIDGTEYAWLAPCSPSDSIEATGNDESRPTQFYITSDKLGLLPVPDDAYTIKIRYYFQSPTVALSGTMPWSGLFNEPIKSFISSRAFARREMTAEGELAIYNELEDKAMRIVSKREGRRPRINPVVG